jgi:hypothetical protein
MLGNTKKIAPKVFGERGMGGLSAFFSSPTRREATTTTW